MTGGTYSHCDSDSVHASTRASSLSPNKFHKICPGRTSGTFGQPQCGDGTSFAFYFSKPPQRVMNDEKILIEFMGGGACWDGDTCGMMTEYLTFPTGLDALVGLSCSEIEAGVARGEGNDEKFPVSMLCAKSVGAVDFKAYNTIVVPYCTQDVHVGSSTMSYGDGSTVRHVGAHNMISVLRWVYRNFPNPFHIALTGCSAGGTALPIAYDLLNKHYNSIFRSPPGLRSVQISVLDDSPVYLTPSYFLEKGLDNWNPWPIMKRIRFNYQNYRHSEDYSTKVWEHVLKRGSNKDSWGFVSFTDDPTSKTYFEYMSGAYAEGDDDGADNNNGNGNDNGGNWWSELSTSLSTVQSNHANVDTFFTNGEGHCSFGLYYPLQQDGFEEWAGNIFRESPILLGRKTASVPLFVTSFILGLGLFGGTLYGKLKRKGSIDLDNVVLLSNEAEISSSKCPRIRSCCEHVTRYLSAVTASLSRFEPYPFTAGFGLAITFYFFTMLCVGGFTHPINNPSLGPSAMTLSSFGINNPSLIVYKSQIWRLTTSTFLCSGVLTYLVVAIFLYKHIRHVETAMQNAVYFILVCLLISFGSNLLYALFTNGASCSSVSLVLGLNAFSITMHISKKRVEYPRPLVGTTVAFVLTCLCLPFNSWIILLCAVTIGCAIALVVFKLDDDNEEDSAGVVTSNAEAVSADKPLKLRMMHLKVSVMVYLLLLLILVFRIRKPSAIYMSPFITGCDLVYTTQVNDIVNTYSYDNRNRRRRGEEEGADGESGDNADDLQSMCAQFCVPHIVSRPFFWGASRYTTYGVKRGTCADDGYGDHVADKTFSHLSYSLDVEIYYETQYGE